MALGGIARRSGKDPHRSAPQQKAMPFPPVMERKIMMYQKNAIGGWAAGIAALVLLPGTGAAQLAATAE